MIIKGVFRRGKRWDPVRPIYGSFWGVGIGIGCGVGWGPGFGPEVVGYVGSGCGAGFSIGITLAGFGIGLPANSFFTNGVSESSRLQSISELQQKIGRAFGSIMVKDCMKNTIDFSGLKSIGLLLTKRLLDGKEGRR
ncbi:unnamed protein product [Cuscuta campestris]|nr:unnamed protein product [Cuscuta campestris]